jgi:hypothetical protein
LVRTPTGFVVGGYVAFVVGGVVVFVVGGDFAFVVGGDIAFVVGGDVAFVVGEDVAFVVGEDTNVKKNKQEPANTCQKTPITPGDWKRLVRRLRLYCTSYRYYKKCLIDLFTI